jgi:CRP-like cAMP-binding protein
MSDPVSSKKSVALPRFPSTIAQRSELIVQTEWSTELTWPQVQTFARYVDAFHAEKGQEVFRQGEKGHYLCLLVEGSVAIVKRDSSGKDKTLATVGTGKTFGEMSLIDGEPRSATAIALDDSKVVVLTEENFNRLSYRHPRLGVALLLKMARLMSQRLRNTSVMLVDFLDR